MSFIPEDMMYAVANMKQVSRNMFRLEQTSSATAGPNRTVTVNLPSNAILDMKSFRFCARFTCDDSVSGGSTAHGLLPGYASSMIQQLSVFINGQQVQQAAPEYHSIAQALRLSENCLDRENSIDKICSHSYISGGNITASDDEQIVVQDWCGFLNESSTRYLNSAIVGDIQVRLVLSGNDALVPAINGAQAGDPLTTPDERNAAAGITYSTSDMYFTIASVNLDSDYDAILRERLAAGGLEVQYKEHYAFELGNITSGSAALRAALSSQSIDRLNAFWRDSNHNTVGVPAHKLPGATGTGGVVSNQLRFRAYNNGVFLLPGLGRSSYSINSVKYPQFDKTLVDCACDLGYVQDKVGQNQGHQVTSRNSFEDGKYVNSLLLSVPTKMGVAVKGGFDSRGLNSAIVWDVRGATVPAANANTGETGVLSAFMVASTTATLNIRLGRDLMVVY